MSLKRPHPLFALILFALLHSWFGLRYGPTTASDGLAHFYRLTALHWAVQHGQFYPRWLPDLAYGYGVPLFNFYPILSYWLAEIWVLLGLRLPVALQVGYALAGCTATIGAYYAGRRLWNSASAGWLAALTYGSAPYLLFNAYHRGAYPELWGLAILAWLVWAITRLRAQPSLSNMLGLVAIATLLCYTHGLTPLISLPLCIAVALWGLGNHPRRWLLATAAAALLLLTTAAYWLPVRAEGHLVRINRTVLLANVSYQQHFRTLAQLLHPPQPYDPLLLQNELATPLALSWLTLALAMLGLTAQRHNRLAWLLALSSASYVLLSHPLSRFVWDALPPLAYIQFPWRFYGPLSLSLALLAGGAATWLPHNRQHYAIAALAVACWLYGLAWSYHIPPIELNGQTHVDIPAYELRTGEIGAAATGEFLTVWAVENPDPQPLQAAYQNNQLPAQRLDRQTLPTNVQIQAEQAGFASSTLQYQADAPFTARFYWMLFPDVRATVDGVGWQTAVEPETGLLQLPDLPAGSHTVQVAQVDSQVQRWGNWLSAFGVLLWLLLWLPVLRPTGHVQLAPAVPDSPSSAVVLVSALCLVAMSARLLWLDQTASPFFRTRLQSNPVAVQGAQQASVNFGEQLRLIGYQTDHSAITLYWQALHPLVEDYSTAVFLRRPDGTTVAQHDNQQPSILPTRFWQPSQYAADQHPFDQPLPAGQYDIVVAVYANTTTGIHNLDVVTAQGLAGYYAVIGMLTVR